MKVITSAVTGLSLVFFFTLTSSATWAVSELGVNRVSLSQEYSEGDPTPAILRFNGGAAWDWLKIGLTSKLLLNPVEDTYSSWDLKFIFPELSKTLVVKTGFDWNDRYKIHNEKVNYKFFPLKTVQMEIGYQNEEREAELATGCPYRLNNQSFALNWQPKTWKYTLNLTRNDKDYYEDAQYTSLKYQLTETLTWYLRRNIELKVGYEENTGDYITSGYKDFWKKEWSFDGKYKSKSKWHWELDYRKLFWERGYEPYRSSHKLQIKMGRSLNQTAKVTFNTTYRDLNYYSTSQDYSEPGVYYKVENDLKSRVETKTGMELQLNTSNFTWKLGPFWGHTDYDSASAKDVNRMGVYATIVWSYRNFEVTLKMAPRGDLLTQNEYYLMEMAYKPRVKEAVNVERALEAGK